MIDDLPKIVTTNNVRGRITLVGVGAPRIPLSNSPAAGYQARVPKPVAYNHILSFWCVPSPPQPVGKADHMISPHLCLSEISVASGLHQNL